jgi:4-amino-4-deoxy-L-arabinose transferase-like glycosyltransferase
LSQGSAAGPQFLLATSTTFWAAPIIIRTGDAVMARGGYHGLDPATTPDSLRRRVDQGQVRFAMLNDVLQLSRRLGADQAGSEVASWIRAHGKLVDPSLWRDVTERGDAELYDLRPATP